jgi:hypothetical protein
MLFTLESRDGVPYFVAIVPQLDADGNPVMVDDGNGNQVAMTREAGFRILDGVCEYTHEETGEWLRVGSGSSVNGLPLEILW